jgi:hypothetical protein
VRLAAKRSGDPTSVSCRPRLASASQLATSTVPVIDDDLTASMDSELLRHVEAAGPLHGPLHGLLNWQRAASTRHQLGASRSAAPYRWATYVATRSARSGGLNAIAVSWGRHAPDRARVGISAIGHSRQRWRVWPARPVMPPCRRDSGQPGVRGIPRASGPRPACPRHARAVGIVNDEIIAGQRENVPALYPLRSSPPGASSNLLAALVRRLKRVCAPHANRARGRPETGIRLGEGVLNRC